MGILSEIFFGGTKEFHKEDGSETERFESGTSITRNADGSIREQTEHKTSLPLGIGSKITVTKDGNGNTINVQEGWGDDD